jgi:uncharacterized protein YndB with AHSA1/START domain
MKQQNDVIEDASEREIIIKRLINAPRELVFEAWTDPKHMDVWWGPNGFQNTTHSFEFKVGGTWNFTMRGPYGDFPSTIVYEEIVRPERIVYTHSGVFKAIITFEEIGAKTELTMRSIFNRVEDLKEAVEKYKAIEGGNQTLDRLEAYLVDMEAKN